MKRKSKKEIEDLLEVVDKYCVPEDVVRLDLIQSTAYNYLIDYIELGENGIPGSHEGNRLFNLCVDILTQFIWDHGWRPKNERKKTNKKD